MGSFSYREKTLLASLLAELVVYGPYFFLHEVTSVTRVSGMIVTIIILQIVLQSAIAIFTRNRVIDERDRLIELRGYRAGYLVLASLIVLGLGMLWVRAAFGDPHMDGRMMASQFLGIFFKMLIVADITKTAAQIVSYRKTI